MAELHDLGSGMRKFGDDTIAENELTFSKNLIMTVRFLTTAKQTQIWEFEEITREMQS